MPLDVVDDPSQVMPVVARTLGLFDGPERPADDRLPVYLAGRSMLLVLDNFEHLLDAAGAVSALLRSSPGVRIVVTSRAPLRVAGEQEYPVQPLGVGGKDAGAAELFVERARAVSPGWDPGSDRTAVEETCRLLDGLPLGLELAAARVSLLPIAVIRDRLAGRMALPGSGPRDVPARQRTLEGTIGWSYDLLEPGQQRLLQDLSVFDGGFDVAQAAQVVADPGADSADILDGIAILADQSLVTRVAGSDGRAVRFRLLQTIRTFALGKLVASGREHDVRRRHALAYLGLLREAAPYLPGRDQPRWLDRLAADQDNVRAATRWSIEAGETELALRLVAAAWRFWQLDGHLVDGHDLTVTALAMPGADLPTPARLGAIAAAGGIAHWRSEPEVADRYYVEQHELAERLGDEAALADAAFNLISTRYAIGGIGGDLDGAREMIEEAARRYRALGDERGLARTEWTAATATWQTDGPAAAIPFFKRALAMFDATGDVWYHVMALGGLTWAYWAIGDDAAAGPLLALAAKETRAMRDIALLTIGLPALAVYALKTHGAETAAMLMGSFETLRQTYGIEPPAGLSFLVATQRPLERAREALGAESYAAAFERGRRLTLDEAIDLVIDSDMPV